MTPLKNVKLDYKIEIDSEFKLNIFVFNFNEGNNKLKLIRQVCKKSKR